mgnify:CR=1 FL=1
MNLPISEEEITEVSRLIYCALESKTYITDVELRQLIADNCQGIFTNTLEFTTYGIRNCLAYILRDLTLSKHLRSSPLLYLSNTKMSVVFLIFQQTYLSEHYQEIPRHIFVAFLSILSGTCDNKIKHVLVMTKPIVQVEQDLFSFITILSKNFCHT